MMWSIAPGSSSTAPRTARSASGSCGSRSATVPGPLTTFPGLVLLMGLPSYLRIVYVACP